jgi:predicted MPP superfamily phosphohydrolase
MTKRARKKEEASVARIDYRNINILTISDLHIPYHHEDSFAFLEALKDRFEPEIVVNLGDFVDNHNISFHDSDPDLLSAGDELQSARQHCQELENIFPKMKVIGSNHGDLPARKFLAHGLPKNMLKTQNDIYGVGAGWEFVDDFTIDTHSKYLPDMYFTHGIRVDALAVARQRGQRVVQGHYHESFRVQYAGNPNTLLWGVNAGCLIDPKSLAYSYNKLNLNRPILGTCVISKGLPILVPMILNKNGRWIGALV